MTARSSEGPLLARALREPGRAVGVALALARGWWYKTWYPLRGIRFSAGRNLRVEGRLTVRGPGRVIFGDDVVVGMHVTPWTHAPDAVIRVGDRAFLNGTRFGCEASITIGEDAIVADAQIMDTDFHSTRADRRSPAAPVRVRPVHLARNVWVAARAGILPGTSIGENSVVGYGAICSGSYPANMLIVGNPARPVKPIPMTPGEREARRTPAAVAAVPRTVTGTGP